ncbi:methyl-accepting chemotaxis, putative [Babesia ovata]|uniref:Methyl-accepting chemotaxis, putative n=1 Tax=Babesia ovata TaxID=189622 RepID=A0A2H6KHA2_9APIC|nr:methyl-accepting chemotaxis, putative [Babesia ovata]GBE62368.1 methyl-accepting chemotaxis, putative [Babesia ovata]
MDNDGLETEVAQEVPSVDLFAGESDYDDDVYRANQVTSGDVPADVSTYTQKAAKKGSLLSLDHLWHNASDPTYEAPRERKNVLWDFLVYHNLREEREGRYMASVQQLETEAVLAIKKAKVAILTEVSEGAHDGLFANDVAEAFDNQVTKLVHRFRLNSMDGSPLFSRMNDDVDGAEQKVALYSYLRKNEEFCKLKSKLAAIRTAKKRLISSSLIRLLSSVDGLRGRVVSGLFEPNSRGFKRVTLTRFLRHLDKISNRSEFAGEYRFDLLKTYVQNREDFEAFIQHNATFAENSDDAMHFGDFVNQFTPDYKDLDLTSSAPRTGEERRDSSAHGDREEPPSYDHMRDFMNATPPDDIMMPPEEFDEPMYSDESHSPPDEPEEPSVAASNEVPQAKQSQPDVTHPNDDDAQLKLLEEARKRAAEILRKKRLSRVNVSSESGTG